MDERNSAPGKMTPVQGESATVQTRVSLLVVDDEPTLRNAYRRLLSRAFDVTLAESGEEALSLIAAGHVYDVILVDLTMPKMDGTELHRRIVADAPELDRRIVFVTGGETTLRTQRYMVEHDNERIYKPFEPEDLRSMINRVAKVSAR